MQFTMPQAHIFVPDGTPTDAALARTTHLCIAAHQDDIEIMAVDGILNCFGVEDKWFTGVVVTDGAGSPRSGLYGSYSDAEMQKARIVEQKKAAFVGEYAAQALLDFPSTYVKEPTNRAVVEDLKALLMATKPQVVYTHNFADKHDTHVGVAFKAVQAIRELPAEARPRLLYGCEVWRALDWMVDDDKVAFDVSAHPNIAASLLGVFDSQIAGGKRYDLATFGRRLANATYFAPHGTDEMAAVSWGVDLTPLIADPSLSIADHALSYVKRFEAEVADRLKRLGG